jgi:leucyl aminopeptidase
VTRDQLSELQRRRSASALPAADEPRISRLAGGLRTAKADAFDALFVIVPEGATAAQLAVLPEPARWQRLNARTKARAGAVRSTTLANAGQTLAVLGYCRQDASAFEKLAVAGRMLKEGASRGTHSVGLAVLGGSAQVELGLEALLAAALAQSFALPDYRGTREEAGRIRRIMLCGNEPIDLAYARAAARGNNLARWLTALPPNVLEARAYRRIIQKLCRGAGIAVRFLDERTLRRLGANAFLAVSAGNAERNAVIAHLKYRPARRRTARADVALVGKGILFDTGGTNLKSHRSMLHMHIDMAGSAVALATLLALAELRAPIAADAWLAITDNRIGPTAYCPQEVVRAANGVTIQVIHTDAEGRMVLADTLALAGRTRPRLMLDFGTLTGACVNALTERMSGIFTNRPALSDALLEAGRASGERVWTFPFDADFDSDLESEVADILQCAIEGKGDHILAARFLSRFVPKETAWVHVDLAAAQRTGGLGHINTDITGFGVRYTLELLLGRKILKQTAARA